MKITVLGSGSPEAYARRASAGYLVEIGADKILLDCGGGVYDNLLRCGYEPGDITHLFFSHLHSDHMMDYARLIHGAWDEGAAPLPVFGPAPLAKITNGYFGKDGVLAHDLVARTEFPGSQQVWLARGGTLPRPWPAPEVTQISAGFTHEGEGWRLTTCMAPHAQPYLDCMAIRIEADGKVFVYSGDAGICDEVRALVTGADLLIHWCYRLGARPTPPEIADLSPAPMQIAQMAAGQGVKRLVLSHIRKYMDEGEAVVSEAAAAAERFGMGTRVAEDRDVFEV